MFSDINKISPVGTDLCVNSGSHVGTDLCVCSLNKNDKTIGDLNPSGKIIEKWWSEIPKKFESIEIDKFVVMPNHFHGILIIRKENNNVAISNSIYKKEQTHRSVPTIDHNIFGNVGLLGQSVQWFKTMTTNEYIKNVKENNWPRFKKQLWQSRFHDRIIRTENEYWAKRIYIDNNPQNWGKDINNKLYIP